MIGYALLFAFASFGLALLLNIHRVIFAPVAADRVLALAAFAGPVMRYVEATAAQLYAPAIYIAAVLGQG